MEIDELRRKERRSPVVDSVTHPRARSELRLRVSVVRSTPNRAANRDSGCGPETESSTSSVNCVTVSPLGFRCCS